MDVDYPAAHSMDSSWFAVDRDGHVAYFSTGEAGAMPAEVTLEAPDQVLAQLARLMPAGEAIHDFEGRIAPGPLTRSRGHHDLHMADYGSLLMFVTSEHAVRAEIEAGQAAPVRSAGGTAVVLRRPGAALVQRLHDAGACRSCFWHYEPADFGGDDGLPPAARLGLFSYGHLCENWISGPYGRKEVPATPLHLDQLPPALRQAVSEMRFDTLCFADTPHIQPVEHAAQVASWESAYLSGDGLTIRAIPGDNNSYRELYRQMTGGERPWLEGIHIEPPPGE